VGSTSPIDIRRDITIDVHDDAGRKVRAYRLLRAWASEFTALPELDANANAVLIQTLRLENEGWERDAGVDEPGEPSLRPQ